MAAQNPTRRNVLLLAVLLFAQLLLMSGDSTAGEAESWAVRVSAPVVRLADWIGGGLRGAIDWMDQILVARRRSVQLERRVHELEDELRARREAAEENTRLRQLLGMRDALVPGSIAASVVTASLGRGDNLVVVDRGTQDGVLPDLPVVAWGGAIGKVETAYERFSKIRLLSDVNSGVAGMIQRSRAQGNVYGMGGSWLELRYVPRFSDVMIGDRVVTSAKDGIFPRGFGIGRVLAVHESPAGLQTIRLDPEVDYAALEEVLILLEPSGSGLLDPPEPEPEPEVAPPSPEEPQGS